MALSAGFALVGCASENAINASLRALQANLVPAYGFSLSNAVIVGSASVSINGSVIMAAPQVGLQTRADNLVTVNVAFGGQVTLVAGSQSVQAEVALSTTVLVGLITNVATAGSSQQITVGIDLSSASVTTVDVFVLLGPPLAPIFQQALTSPQVLNALTTALRAVPAGLLQFTDATLGLPLTVSQTYQPPTGSTFSPDTLFDMQFSVNRVVARPLDAATPGPGALAVAVDIAVSVAGTSVSVTTNGDPSALVDLNSATSQAGASVEYENDGSTTYSPSANSAQGKDSSLAFVVDADWLSGVVNSMISPQLAGKFVSPLAEQQVAFTASPDCVQLSFNEFAVPLDSPWAGIFPTNIPMAGVNLQVKATRFMEVTQDSNGYYQGVGGIPGNADVVFTANIIVLLQSFASQFPGLPQQPSGSVTENVMFSTTPTGGYSNVDGTPIRTGLGPWASTPIGLAAGTVYDIWANPVTFQSWSTTGNAFLADANGNYVGHSSSVSSTGMKVTGPGTLSLQESGFDPFLTRDFWSMAVVGSDISLPWWLSSIPLDMLLAFLALEPVAIFIPPIVGALGVAGLLLALFTKVSNANALALAGVQSAINGAALYTPSMLVAQVPGTTVPSFLTTIGDVGLGTEGLAAYSSTSLLPPGLFSGSTGSFPYLMVTDQDVSDPSTVPGIPDPSGGFPLRIDGSFKWPGVAWNQPGSGAPGGSVSWDVHDLRQIGVVLKVPPGLFNAQDPTVLVQWKVERTDTNAVVISKTLSIGQAGAPGNIFAVSIDHGSASLQQVDQFLVTCSLFRPLANGGIEQIFSSGDLYITIADHFDRHHPYVQWGPSVAYIYPGQPFWNAIPRKAHVPGVKLERKVRASRIHRTDLWDGGGRCLVADTSGQAGARMMHGVRIAWDEYQRGFPPGWITGRGLDWGWTYIDTLPISLDDVRRDRELALGILCDYCFFGGPTKTQLRSDFP